MLIDIARLAQLKNMTEKEIENDAKWRANQLEEV